MNHIVFFHSRLAMASIRFSLVGLPACTPPTRRDALYRWRKLLRNLALARSTFFLNSSIRNTLFLMLILKLYLPLQLVPAQSVSVCIHSMQSNSLFLRSPTT